MTVRFLSGFEQGKATPDITSDQYVLVSGTVSVQSSVKKTGNYALRANPVGAATGLVRVSQIGTSGAGRGGWRGSCAASGRSRAGR